MKFPSIRKILPTTLSGLIKSVEPKVAVIVEEYTDHMGRTVQITEEGYSMSYCDGNTSLFGDYGHSFSNGWFIVDENEEFVYPDNERYAELHELCAPFWQLMNGLKKNFMEYRVEHGRGQRLFVNDKMIKGILVYPGMRMRSIDEEIKSISEFIQADIDSGKIIMGQYGVPRVQG